MGCAVMVSGTKPVFRLFCFSMEVSLIVRPSAFEKVEGQTIQRIQGDPVNSNIADLEINPTSLRNGFKLRMLLTSPTYQ